MTLACTNLVRCFQGIVMNSRLSILLVALFFPAAGFALGPADVFIIANKKMPDSVKVAEHYCAKRGVPKDQIVLLDLPTSEDISRKEFNLKLRDPLQLALKDKRSKVK